MVSGRPLLYLSLPGVAFILGVFWFRRRNKNRVAHAEIECDEKEELNKDIKEPEEKSNGTVTQSEPIPGGSDSVNIRKSSESDDDNPATKLFGKSAPIKILQNGRGSPAKQTQQQVDSEVLKTKIQNVENKVLRSIDEDFENLSSPVDLPDSMNNRVSFYSRNINTKKDEPVVIKATTTPKISPENSFLESTYSKECEQNNNCNPKGLNVDKTKTIIEETQDQQINVKNQDDSNGNEMLNVDAVSPPLSLCSIQSGDSGKGSSLPRSEATRAKTTYEFFFPNSLVGHLYGKNRTFLNQIQAKTSARVILRSNLYSGKVQVCTIEGTENEIKAALLMIRQRLPAKRYPNFTMQRIYFALPQTIVPLPTESLLNLQLNLIEGINNDVVVSAVVSGGHIFVQHPLHPSHPSLALLQKCLHDSYSSLETPLLPCIEISAVCVMPVNGNWYRVQIVESDSEDVNRCVVKFLDFGGYMNVHYHELRQIRSDFMAMPFQATECMLSNIEPIDSGWTSEAADTLSKLTKGIVLQAQIAGYNSHNIPEIYLYACLGPNNFIFINKEMVARNLAQWVEERDSL